jgi:hypothetical protein
MVLCGFLIFASVASATLLPAPPYNTNYLRFDQDYWTITDVDGYLDDSTFILGLENASYESDFGLYMVNADSTLTRFQIFSYLQGPFSWANVYFKYGAGIWSVKIGTSGTYVPFSNVFGFYYGIHIGGRTDSDADYLVYTDNKLNPNSREFIGTWWDNGNNGYIFLDDQLNGFDDNDYNDMTVIGNDIRPAPVPEPASMLLFGTGLMVFGFVGRKLKTK